jgi:hypothetical protein
MLQTSSLNSLSAAVVDASNLIALITATYNGDSAGTSTNGSVSSGVVNTLRKIVITGRNFILSDVDAGNINNAQEAVEKALLSFKTALSGVQALQGIKSVLDNLKEALSPVDFSATVSRHMGKYFAGSREWLFSDFFQWLDDMPAAASTGFAKRKVSWDTIIVCYFSELSTHV